MACERWREMISAQLDGEDDPADRPLVDEHLAGCAGCRQWLDSAATVNRLTRTGPVAEVPDLTDRILAAMPAQQPARRMPGFKEVPGFKGLVTQGRLYFALALVGAVQLILGLTQVGGGTSGAHVHTGLDATPGHLWHESAAWNVAVGAGLLFIALRRTRPTGLVPMLTAFVGMLVLLSVNDLSAGRVDATRLVSHGFVVIGYLLVVALSRTGARTAPPPGARSPVDTDHGGWRARFDDETTTPAAPKLRLVPPGPMTASAEETRKAAA